MFRSLFVAGLLLGGSLMVTTAAVAADLPVKAEPLSAMTSPAVNWTGFYVGAFGGYHYGNVTQEGCVGLCPVDPKLKGGLFGFQGGYDYEFSNHVVLGGFGWVPLTRLTASYDLGSGLIYDVRTRFAALAAARVGYAFDRWLPYVFGGVGYANIEISSGGTSWREGYFGPVVGLGVEYSLMCHVSVDFRYMYSSAPKKTYDFGGGPEQYGEFASNFLAAVNYRF